MADRPADRGLRGAGIDGSSWLRALPSLLDERLSDWDLTPAGSAVHGVCAMVLPVTRADEALMLKLSWPHVEAVTEHLALRHWAGEGAVRLVAAQPSSYALLLEALDPAADLSEIYIDEACEVIGGLLARLNVPAPPPITRFADLVGGWLEPLRAHPTSLPRRMVDRALEVFDGAEPANALLHMDLHYQNVLAGDREPWLAIDPKPVAGPPGFEIYPALRNRVAEYGTGSALRWQVRRRVELISEAAGIDWDEAREWSIVRALLNAYESAQGGDRDQTTLHLAIAQALDTP